MSKKSYPPNVKIKFSQDWENIKKGFEHEFGAATAANFMRLGVAWPTSKEEESKLPETIQSIKEREEELKNPKKKRRS